MTEELQLYNKMVLAIKECHRIDEARKIESKYSALQVYQRQAKNFEAERLAAEIRVRASRRVGELLREMKESGERATKESNLKRGTANPPSSQPDCSERPTLSDLGVSDTQARRWQKLADIPEEEFEEEVTSMPMPSTQRLIKEKSRRERVSRLLSDRDLQKQLGLACKLSEKLEKGEGRAKLLKHLAALQRILDSLKLYERIALLLTDIEARRKANHDEAFKSRWNPDQIIKAEQTQILNLCVDRLRRILNNQPNAASPYEHHGTGGYNDASGSTQKEARHGYQEIVGGVCTADTQARE